MNKLVKRILDTESKNKLYLAITGGGTSAISELLRYGSASKIFMGAIIPYSQEELEFLIGSYSKAVSLPVAKQLAKVGYTRSFSDNLEYACIGIGATCSLAKAEKERADREHKICLAVSRFTKDKVETDFAAEIVLTKKRTREEEEELVSNAILSLADCYLNLTKLHPITHGYKNIGFEDDEINSAKLQLFESEINDKKSD